MIPVRQSTAFETAIGPILDADGVAVTGGVVGDLKLKKTSGNFAALNGSATLTHVSAGVYDLVLTTSDTDTVGLCVVAIDDTVNACASLYLQVMEEAVYDALYAASATGALPVSSGGIAATAFAAGAIDAAALAADAGTELGTAVWASATRTLTSLSGLTVDTVTTLTNLPAITANWLTAAGTHSDFGTEIGAAVLSALGTGSWASAIPWNASWDAEVQSEVDDALVAQRLDELLNADSDIDGAAPPTVGSVFHELMSKTAGSFTFDQTTDSNEALRDRGDAAWITATGFSTHSAADVWAVGTRSLTILDEDSTTLDLDATIRAAVGLAAANLDTQIDALPTANEVRNAVTGGAYALDTDANGRVRIVDGTAAGELDTASGLVKISGTIQTLDALDTAQDVEHDATQAAIAALNNLSAAQVNAEVVDALATDTYAEPGQENPGATISLAKKVGFIYKSWRNKKDNDGNTTNLYADNGTTIDQKQTTSVALGVVTKAEWITGA